MKILYISQYFPPEICAPSNRAVTNVKYLSKKGHRVTVLTEMPNHPKGVIFDGYKGKIFLREKIKNILINRVWVCVSKKKNFITRILFYSSFMLLGTIYSLIKWERYDLLFISSPPLLVAGIGIFLKLIFPKVKIVFEVRDLWPESAIALEELQNKHFISLSKKLEKRIYNISEKIIVVSKYIKEQIRHNGIQAKKITIIYNGVEKEFISRKKFISKELLNKYKQSRKFLVTYAGNIGIAQGLETILRTPQELEKKNILFLLIGSGPKEKELKQTVLSKHIDNIEFIGEISRDKIYEYLYLADCGIIPLRRLQLYKGALPSKIFDYMSCELPILLGIEGEAKSIIETSGAGLCFKPEDYIDLAKKILWMKNNPRKRIEMGKKGKEFVKKYFTREMQSEILEKELLELLEQK